MPRPPVVYALATAVLTAMLLALLSLIPWPGAAPWQEEISGVEYQSLANLGARTTPTDLAWTLGILDPLNQLAPILQTRGQVLRVSEPGVQAPVDIALAGASLPSRPQRALAGMRVLLDPGHFGGAWSEPEGRQVMAHNNEVLREGDLTFATAMLLRQRLQNAGAQAILTRGPPPTTVFSAEAMPGFDPKLEAALVLTGRLARHGHQLWHWLYPAWIAGAALTHARDRIAIDLGFSLFNQFDLRRRAALAAATQADVTVSLHFNTAGLRRDNWVVVFVPGNSLPGELATMSERYHAIRRALAGELPDMIDLATRIAAAMEEVLDVPRLLPDPGSPDPLTTGLPLTPGVFARNLAVLRRSAGPAVLVEGPCLDNATEQNRLRLGTVEIEGRQFPRRVDEVAEAVFQGLREWCEAGYRIRGAQAL